MDFHLFFCCANVKKLAAMLPDEERNSVRPLWEVNFHVTHASSDAACACAADKSKLLTFCIHEVYILACFPLLHWRLPFRRWAWLCAVFCAVSENAQDLKQACSLWAVAECFLMSDNM